MKRGLYLILLILTSKSVLFAQSKFSPNKIDVSQYFEKINEINTHLKDANLYHYRVSKRFVSKLGKISIGIGGSAYMINQDIKTQNQLWRLGTIPFLSFIFGVLLPSDKTDKESEQISLLTAKKIIGELKTGKTYNR